MKLIVIALAVLLTAQPVLAEWTSTDSALEATFNTFLWLDAAQTRDIHRHKDKYEMNPILGRNPSQDKILAYFAATSLVHGAISYALATWAPKDYVKIWEGITIGGEATTVMWNAGAGIKIKF